MTGWFTKDALAAAPAVSPPPVGSEANCPPKLDAPQSCPVGTVLVEDLCESQQWLRFVVDALPIRLFWKDRNSVYLGGNQLFARDAGVASPEALVGKTDADLTWQEAAARYRAEDVAIMESGQARFHYHDRHRTADGTELVLLTSKMPLRNLQNEIIGVLGLYEDISARCQTEERLRLLETALTAAASTVVITDVRSNILWVNPAFTVSTGYSMAEALGQNPRLLKSGEHPPEFYQQMWQTISQGQVWYGKLHNRRKDGTPLIETATITPVQDAAGNITHYIAVKQDITSRSLAEQAAQRQQEAKLRYQAALLKLSAHPSHRFESSLEEILRVAAQTLGVARVSFWRFRRDPDALLCEALFLSATNQFERGLELRRADYPCYFAGLDHHPVLAVALAQTDPRTAEFTTGYLQPLGITSLLDVPVWLRGHLVGVLCHEQVGPARHWTPEEQDFALSIGHLISFALSERELAVREQRFNGFFSHATLGLCILDQQFHFVQANAALAGFTGAPVAAHLGQSVASLWPGLAATLIPVLERVRAAGQAVLNFPISGEMPARPGVLRHWTVSYFPLPSATTATFEIGGIVVETTEQVQAEVERKNIEVQLRHAQKLESIGQLAAGIAHEINTPTQFVGDNLRFLQDSLAQLQGALELGPQLLHAAQTGGLTPEVLAQAEQTLHAADLDYLLAELPKAITEARQGVERVSKIVRAMKDFSHPGGDEKSLVDLNKAIESTVTVARNEWKYVADLVMDFDPQLPLVQCLPGEFNQVILNLVVNAAHAIGDVVGAKGAAKGQITVSTKQVEDWVEVRVQDTGAGIPEAIQHRIFEPFFTTKTVGKGTGQGLAIARSVIVDKHGGQISFETQPGIGTTFIIRLPRTAGRKGGKP